MVCAFFYHNRKCSKDRKRSWFVQANRLRPAFLNMSWFSFQRSEGFPTQYEPNATSVTADILEVGLLAALIIVLLTFAFVFVPSRRWKTVSKFQMLSFMQLKLLEIKSCRYKFSLNQVTLLFIYYFSSHFQNSPVAIRATVSLTTGFFILCK